MVVQGARAVCSSLPARCGGNQGGGGRRATGGGQTTPPAVRLPQLSTHACKANLAGRAPRYR